MVTGEHETQNGAPGLQWLHVHEAAVLLTGTDILVCTRQYHWFQCPHLGQ